MAKKLNGNAKWIALVMILAGMIFGFGQKSKAMEKDAEANATAIELIRDDLKVIKTDVKVLLSRP